MHGVHCLYFRLIWVVFGCLWLAFMLWDGLQCVYVVVLDWPFAIGRGQLSASVIVGGFKVEFAYFAGDCVFAAFCRGRCGLLGVVVFDGCC